jgi:hypothetical protein
MSRPLSQSVGGLDAVIKYIRLKLLKHRINLLPSLLMLTLLIVFKNVKLKVICLD